LRVEFEGIELKRRVKQAGVRWDSAKRAWEIYYDQAVALGLKNGLGSWKCLILDTIRCPILDIPGYLVLDASG